MRGRLLAAAILGAVGVARGDVLYDTLWITNTLVVDAGVGNAVGGWRVFPSLGLLDTQLADDFEVVESVRLTRVLCDYSTFDPGDFPAEGFRVSIYADSGGRPGEAAFAETIVQATSSVLLGLQASREAYRHELDVRQADIVLQPGRWWMDIQPLDEAGGGWFWASSLLSPSPPIGMLSHVRDGWLAHGTLAGGLWNTTTWVEHTFRGNAAPSRRIEGDPLSSLCPPDLTGSAIPGSAGYGVPDGVLNNDDFFYYLIAFGSGNLAVADLTTTAIPGSPGYGVPNGVINNDDFFFYLIIFSAGC